MTTAERAQPFADDELERLRRKVADYENDHSEMVKLVARIGLEINDSLAALLGQTQLLLREDINETARRRAEIIESQAKRLHEVSRKLRDLNDRRSTLSTNAVLDRPGRKRADFEGPS